MSRQLTFSATVCTLTMALFALAAGLGPVSGDSNPQIVSPLAIQATVG